MSKNEQVKSPVPFPSLEQFSTSFLGEQQLKSARLVTAMFPFVDSVNVWRRHVEVTHRESPLMVLTLQHRNKARTWSPIVYMHNMMLTLGRLMWSCVITSRS